MFGGLESIDEVKSMLRMLEVEKKKKNGLDVNDEKSNSLFPEDWGIDNNNEEKIDILIAAIDKNEIIVNNDEYQKYKGDFHSSK